MATDGTKPMMNRQRTTRNPNGGQSSKDTPRQLVHSVTRENYQEVGSAFIGMFGSAIIALKDGTSGSEVWAATPRQWGAWRAYFKTRGITTRFMDDRGRQGKSWTVPAPWPHEFDADATVQGDMQAADIFARRMQVETVKYREISVDLRREQVGRLIPAMRKTA